MKIERENLINVLESVLPGVSPQDVVEQSSCVVFNDDQVVTFNDEIACTMALPDGFKLTGAVVAQPLIDLLRKMPDEVIDVTLGDSGDLLLIKGKGRKGELRMESEILLPIGGVDTPDKWAKIDPHFIEAMDIAYNCTDTSKDASFMLKCVHVTPDHVEACDNFQLLRYPVKTGVNTKTLIRRDSVKFIKTMDVVELGETQTWMHFKTARGLVLSCRRYPDEYPNLSDMLIADETSPVDLPPGLAEAVVRAEVFSSEDADNNEVTIRLKQNMVEVRGDGATGKFTERKKIKYNGPAVVFRMSPSLLCSLIERHHEAEVSDTRMVVDNGKFRYVTCLGEVN